MTGYKEECPLANSCYVLCCCRICGKYITYPIPVANSNMSLCPKQFISCSDMTSPELLEPAEQGFFTRKDIGVQGDPVVWLIPLKW